MAAKRLRGGQASVNFCVGVVGLLDWEYLQEVVGGCVVLFHGGLCIVTCDGCSVQLFMRWQGRYCAKGIQKVRVVR